MTDALTGLRSIPSMRPADMARAQSYEGLGYYLKRARAFECLASLAAKRVEAMKSELDRGYTWSGPQARDCEDAVSALDKALDLIEEATREFIAAENALAAAQDKLEEGE